MMTGRDDFARGNVRLRALATFALTEGWRIARTTDGRCGLAKSGFPMVYVGVSRARSSARRGVPLRLVSPALPGGQAAKAEGAGDG